MPSSTYQVPGVYVQGTAASIVTAGTVPTTTVTIVADSRGYQLATDASVMPIGGFNGSDPSPTLAQFRQLVADGRIHYFISGGFGGGGPGGGSGTASEISSWVTSSFTSTTVGGVTLYDLTAPVSG